MVGSAGRDRSTTRSAFNTATGGLRHRAVASGVLVLVLATVLAGCGSTSSVSPTQSLNAGLFAFSQRNYPEARADHNAVVRDDPNNTYGLKLLAWYDLGVLDQKLGRTVAAGSEYRAALAPDPKYTNALYNLAVLESPKDPIAVISLYREAYALSPRDPNVQWNLGLLLYSRGQVAEGRKFLNNAIRIDASLRARLPKSVKL
jgi:tetratricopeptide (TPR) repeat protein